MAPVDQVLPPTDEEVNVTVFPAQIVVDPLAVMVGVVGVEVAVTTVVAEVAEQPPLVTVTEYEPEFVTTMDCVVAPVDQRLPEAAEEVSITDPGVQNVVGPPAVIVGVAGTGFTVTVVPADAAD